MTDKLKELQETRLTIEKKIKDHADKLDSDATLEQQGEWKATWDTLNKSYDDNKAELDAENQKLELQASVNGRLAEIENSLKNGNRPRFGRDGGTIEEGPANPENFTGARGGDGASVALHAWMLHNAGRRDLITDRHRQAAASLGVELDSEWFRLDLGNTSNFQRARARRQADLYNAMTIGDPATGGYTVGTTLLQELERAMLDYSGVLQFADIIRTATGEQIEWPTIDDTSNEGSNVGETSAAAAAADPSLGKVVWHAHDYSSGILQVSRNLLTDSFVDFESRIGQMLGERIARKQNTDFTTGYGGGVVPRGIVTAATSGVTANSATSIAYDEVIDLEHSIDPSLRNREGVGYSMHDSILQHLRKLKDGEGRYLWQSGANTGSPDRLNNRPYFINQAMDSTMSSGKKTLLFGALRNYKVRQVGTVMIQRLRERYAEFNKDGFIAHTRADGNLLDAGDNPVKYLSH